MRVQDAFEGKQIFITGGSGFCGKVLIEKLLRCCPGIGTIYILMRSKKGKSPQERLKHIVSLALFDKIRESNPETFNKLVAINGDVADLRLGMSEEDRQLLIDNVNIIYHTAASVRFDDLLQFAIIMNVRGTREVAELALEIKNLSVFVHVSTTYCNTDKKVIEEKIYPAHTDWRNSIKLAEESEPALIEALTLKYIDPLPNTYTFAKSLAEHVVNDLCTGKIPTVIFRPSVVISTIRDPIPGWNDNFNGPVGLLVAGGKGLLRTIWGEPDSIQDYMPVDIIATFLILAAQKKILNGNADVLEVYNGSKSESVPYPIGEIVDLGARLIWDSPFSQILWYPWFKMTRCWYNFYIQVLLYHMLPAIFLDTVLKISGNKPMFIKLHRKIYIANVVLEYFIRNSWNFLNTRCRRLADDVSIDDQVNFGTSQFDHLSTEEIYDYYKSGKIGAMRYLLHEKFDQEQSRKKLWRLWLLDTCARVIFYLIVLWFIIKKTSILNTIGNYFNVM